MRVDLYVTILKKTLGYRTGVAQGNPDTGNMTHFFGVDPKPTPDYSPGNTLIRNFQLFGPIRIRTRIFKELLLGAIRVPSRILN